MTMLTLTKSSSSVMSVALGTIDHSLTETYSSLTFCVLTLAFRESWSLRLVLSALSLPSAQKMSSLLQDFLPKERQNHNWDTGILATESLLISYAGFILISSLYFYYFSYLYLLLLPFILLSSFSRKKHILSLLLEDSLEKRVCFTKVKFPGGRTDL